MSEELRREAELNEAELENASGGDQYTIVISDAQQLCNNCPLRPARACNQETLLKQYLLSLYPKRIRRYTECPYYNK